MMTLEEAVKKVRPLNEKAIESAKKKMGQHCKAVAFSGGT